jgi:uncharacterized protein YukE
MTERTSAADLHNCEQAVIAAARKERAAHAALLEGIKPLHPSWRESDEEAYEARLAHWQAASRTLVDALNRLKPHDTKKKPPARMEPELAVLSPGKDRQPLSTRLGAPPT